MMPKGVEHRENLPTAGLCFKVRIPMMPKGVEHVQIGGRSTGPRLSENSNDAERR